jgi:hypothetical protein
LGTLSTPKWNRHNDKKLKIAQRIKKTLARGWHVLSFIGQRQTQDLIGPTIRAIAIDPHRDFEQWLLPRQHQQVPGDQGLLVCFDWDAFARSPNFFLLQPHMLGMVPARYPSLFNLNSGLMADGSDVTENKKHRIETLYAVHSETTDNFTIIWRH